MSYNLNARLRERLWDREPASAREARLLAAGRYVAVLARDLLGGELSLRAMSLVYTTLLSVVPLLALAFSLLKALGVHNSLEPALRSFLDPLGPQAETITRNVIGFVENIKVGVLGFLGVGLLLYSAVSVMQKVESSFNHIWRIEGPRRFGARFGEYLAVLIVGPVLVFAALGITGSALNSAVVAKLTAVEPLGALVFLISKLIPYLLIIGLFTFLYGFIPNTRVKPRAAFAGGLLAGVLWQSASVVFAYFAKGSSNYNAIYSGFAILFFLLIWIYLGWLILMLGCQLAFYVQHPEHLRPTRHAPLLSARLAEQLGLVIVALVGRRFLAGEPPLTEEEISRHVNAAPEHVARVIEVLRHHGVLIEAGAGGTRLLPGRDLDSLTVAQLWQLLRRGFDEARIKSRDELSRAVGALLDEAETGFAQASGRATLRQWLAGS